MYEWEGLAVERMGSAQSTLLSNFANRLIACLVPTIHIDEEQCGPKNTTSTLSTLTINK